MAATSTALEKNCYFAQRWSVYARAVSGRDMLLGACAGITTNARSAGTNRGADVGNTRIGAEGNGGSKRL
jgi:hypothetical protein